MAGKMKSERFNFTEEFWNALAEIYPQKGGSSVLASRFGIPSATVSAKAKECGIKSHREVTQKFYRESVLNGYFEKVLREWGSQEGGFERVGELFGIHSGTARAKARELGIATEMMELIQYHKEYLREDFFEEIDDVRAYVFGYLWADGSIREDVATKIPDALQLRCERKDEGLIIQIRDLLRSRHSIVRSFIKDSDGNIVVGKGGAPLETTTIVICSRKIASDLMSLYGILPRKTFLDSAFPEWLSSDLLPHFVRGNFDGDGCCWQGNSRGHLEQVLYYSGTKLFMEGLAPKVIQSAGVRSKGVYSHKNLYNVAWSSMKDIRLLYTWMYPTPDVVCLPRKRLYLEAMLSGSSIPATGGEPMADDPIPENLEI